MTDIVKRLLIAVLIALHIAAFLFGMVAGIKYVEWQIKKRGYFQINRRYKIYGRVR